MAPPAATTSPAGAGGASRVAAIRPGVLGGEVAGALAALRGLLSVHNAASTSTVTSAAVAPQVSQTASAPRVAVQTTPQAVHQTVPIAALQSAPWRRPSPEERLASLVADNALIGPLGQPGGLPPMTSGIATSQPGNIHAGAGTLDMSTNYVLTGTQSFLHSLSGEMQAQSQMHPAIPDGHVSTAHVLAQPAQLQPQSSLDTLGLSTVNPGMHGAQLPPMQPQVLPPIQHTLLAPVAYQQGAGQVPPQAANYGSVFSMQSGVVQQPQATGMSSIEVPVSAFQASLAEQARLQTAWPPVPPTGSAAPGPVAHPSQPERPHDPRVAPMQPPPLAALGPADEQQRLAQYEATVFGNTPVADRKRPAEALPSEPWNSRRRSGDGPQ